MLYFAEIKGNSIFRLEFNKNTHEQIHFYYCFGHRYSDVHVV